MTEAFERWKADLLARVPKDDGLSAPSAPSRWIEPPHIARRNQEICAEIGKAEYERRIKQFEMFQHENAALDEMEGDENPYSRRMCYMCQSPMTGMTPRERAEHYLRCEQRQIQEADRRLRGELDA